MIPGGPSIYQVELLLGAVSVFKPMISTRLLTSLVCFLTIDDIGAFEDGVGDQSTRQAGVWLPVLGEVVTREGSIFGGLSILTECYTTGKFFREACSPSFQLIGRTNRKNMIVT